MTPDEFNPSDPTAEPIGDSSGADPGLEHGGPLPELRSIGEPESHDLGSDEPEPTQPDLTPEPLEAEHHELQAHDAEPSEVESSEVESSGAEHPKSEPIESEQTEPALTESELPESELTESEQTESEQTEPDRSERTEIALAAPIDLDLQSLETRRAALQQEIAETQDNLGQMIREALQELRDRKRALKLSIEQLEKKQERLKTEMRQSFAGASQDVAVRLQSFKDYLVGSLLDLTSAAEGLNLGAGSSNKVEVISAKADAPAKAPENAPAKPSAKPQKGSDRVTPPQFVEQEFGAQQLQINKLLDLYRTKPDYYGPAWQLRRTFEPIQVDRVTDWFFQQGGRGAIPALNSRLQNILVASAIISVLNEFYGERLCVLILANSPERLGDWRRGLQDCLGLTREDFGPSQGVVLFEAPEPMAQRADRLLRNGDLPLIILDEAEEFISLALLQFPLWLAFAPDPRAAKPAYTTDPRTPKSSYY
jgi:Protein of unknown function (DUF3086)